MKFSRLRLSGFKSFVEPSELFIEPGLTGVVGPNGCGKSNLLEALRWVMGESSYKNMRASGMDDVIFSGTSKRPARNMAEVTITLENSNRTAPAAFNDSDTLEISRRIEREAGSAYRINGQDVRARDVQLLFADASTGARSPALVRQGQIGEIINSKPQSRRRILEEAAGITGLHTRRHEAELKLNAAETNLTRLDDVVAQLENQLQSLKRQARQAARYKGLSGEIRQLEATSLYMNWRDAGAAVEAEQAQLNDVMLVMAGFTKAVSEKTRARDEATEKLPKLRENETVRSAVLQRLNIELEGLQREEAQATKRREELDSRLTQTDADQSREQEMLSDTDGVLTRLLNEETTLNNAQNGDATARNQAARMLQEAADQLAKSQQLSDAEANRISELTAQRNALSRAANELEGRVDRLGAEMSTLKDQQASLNKKTGAGSSIDDFTAKVEQAVTAAKTAENLANNEEASLREKRQRETQARTTYDEARRQADQLATEMRTLSNLLNVTDGDLWPPLIDALKVKPGYETALGAALGDDIDASGDEAAPVHWRSLPDITDIAALPGQAEALAKFVTAPPALARRLSHIGVIEATDGPELQKQLRPGQRLVTQAGDLWRWDGFSAAGDAPTAAAKRLAERNRLGQLEHAAKQAQTDANKAQQAFEAARKDVEKTQASERQTREAWRAANNAVEQARSVLAGHERAMAETMRQISAVTEAARRVEANLSDARSELSARRKEIANLAPLENINDQLDNLRRDVDKARTDYSEARARHDGLEREAKTRLDRLKAIAQERQQWQDRVQRAKAQITALSQRAEEARKEILELADLPKLFKDKQKKLLSALSTAETERQEAADKLAEAENIQRAIESEQREAESQLAAAREEHARLGAKAEAAREKRKDAEIRISETMQCAPSEIAKATGLDLDKLPVASVVEEKLVKLRDQRERLGGVNLRAEQEAEEMSGQLDNIVTERDDLIQAIGKLRHGINSLNREGRQRLLEAFATVNENFSTLFTALFNGGHAELQLVESDDPLEAGLELLANPPGKRPQVLSLLSGGEQALTAMALIFAVFLTNPSPICVLDEVDAPLDDHNVERFCNLLDAMLERTDTRFLIITHHALTMARMNRLFGVTMMERGISQLVSVDLETAESLREAS